MQPPDVTTAASEWERTTDRTALWKNLIHDNVYSTDGGITFTISTEREDPECAREVFTSRKV